MAKYSLIAAVAAAFGLTLAHNSSFETNKTCPNIAETSHASPEAVRFFHGFFTAKSFGDGDDWLQYWNPTNAAYYDSTLGLTIFANYSQLKQGLSGTPTNTKGESYPLRILGDIVGGAIVYFIDTPGLYGAEIRSISSFNFINGRVSRSVDNWDGRGNAAKASLGSSPEYPTFGLSGLKTTAAAKMQSVANRLNNALSTGNVTAASALFSYDAIFEDLTLRTRIEGAMSIQAYFTRALGELPYGPGTEITHIVGNAQGGGYEWRPTGSTVRYGITALELDAGGNITQLTVVWDGSVVNQTTIQGLAKLAPTA